MSYRGSEKRRILEEFSAVRKRATWVVIPLVTIRLLWIFEDHDGGVFGIPGSFFRVVTWSLAIGLVVLNYLDWRCPACRKYLRKFDPKVCPKCGVELRR